MKKHICLFCVLLSGFLPAAHAGKSQLKTQAQQGSYALAVDYMKKLRQDDLTLDNQAFLQGLQDVQAGRESQLNPQQTRDALDNLIKERYLKHEAKLQENLLAGRSFLLANMFRDGVKELPSGLQYKVLQNGTSQNSPKAGDGISVRYRISDIDGKELFRSSSEDKPRKMVMGEMIPAWNEALPLMQEGAKWQLFVPPTLAFGEKGALGGRIKANQTLVYDLELVAIVPKEEARAEMDKPEIVSDKPAGVQ